MSNKIIAELCDEVAEAIERDKLDLATTTALRLRPLVTELDGAHSAGVYAKVVALTAI